MASGKAFFLKKWFCNLVFWASILAIGCTLPPDRRHPTFQYRLPHIRTVLCLTPEFGVFTESNNICINNEAGSLAAKGHIVSGIVRTMSDLGYIARFADPSIMSKPEVLQLVGLYHAVNRSIQLHTYGPQLFPSKQKVFDYSIGPISDLLDAQGVDALMLIMGSQTASNTRPKTWLSIAMIDPNGWVIWYAIEGATQDLQLQMPEHADSLVSKTLATLVRGRS